MIAAWTELCASLSDEQFIAACKHHLRASTFFPCPADILKAHEAHAPRNEWPTMLPEEDKSPEELHRTALNAAMVRAALRNPEAKAFFHFSQWSEKEAMARKFLGSAYPELHSFTARQSQREVRQ